MVNETKANRFSFTYLKQKKQKDNEHLWEDFLNISSVFRVERVQLELGGRLRDGAGWWRAHKGNLLLPMSGAEQHIIGIVHGT